MKVYITGKAENISNKEIRDAVYFYLRKLLGKSMSQKITLYILIEKDLLKTYEMYAAISPLETETRPKHYELEIDAKLPKKQFLVSLAHEMIHLKQFAKDQMKDLESKRMTRWLGEYYIEENLDYWSRPWEKEAHDNEIPLYQSYLAEKNK